MAVQWARKTTKGRLFWSLVDSTREKRRYEGLLPSLIVGDLHLLWSFSVIEIKEEGKTGSKIKH